MAKTYCYVDHFTGKSKNVTKLFGIPIKTNIEDNEFFGDWVERNLADGKAPDWHFSHVEPIRVASNMNRPGPGFFRALMLCNNLGRRERMEEAQAAYLEVCSCDPKQMWAPYRKLEQQYPKAAM